MCETHKRPLARERDAINAIQKSLKILLNGGINYNGRPKENWSVMRQNYIDSLKSYEIFWGNCLESFRVYVDGLNVESKQDEDIFTNLQSQKKRKRIRWHDDIDDFKELYKHIENTYLSGSPYQKKRERLFDQLFFEIGEALREKRTIVGNLKFGNLRLEFLPQMISLDDPDIRALLPYLLTAYTFNSCDSKFFLPDKKLLQILLGKEKTSAIEAPKQRKRIENFSNIFSLKNLKNPKGDEPYLICSNRDDYPYTEEEFNRIKTEIKRQNIAALKYRVILNGVFRKWCEIVIEAVKKSGTKDIENTVNLSQCTILYNFYTGQRIHLSS